MKGVRNDGTRAESANIIKSIEKKGLELELCSRQRKKTTQLNSTEEKLHCLPRVESIHWCWGEGVKSPF